MKNICNNCGQVIPDGAKVCPNCGTPAPNASPDEKKFWDRDDLKPVDNDDAQVPPIPGQAQSPATGGSTPPPPPDTAAASGAQPTPPPFYTAPKKSRHKYFWVSIILAAIAVALIIIMMIWWIAGHTTVHYEHHSTQEHTTVQKTPNGSITITTSGNMTDAQADSMMQAAMAEMQQTDSAMQAMMNAMMGSADPFAGEPMGSMGPARVERRAPVKASTMPKMAGHIGQREFMMVLNVKDPQNVKGSGSFIKNGKEQAKLHMLGIGDGHDLTVSIYGPGNKLMGTLAGTYDGMQYQGTYQVDGKETPFQLYVQ